MQTINKNILNDDIVKEAALKIPSPKKAIKNMPLGKKINLGIGAGASAIQLGQSTVSAGKELLKPMDTKSLETGFVNLQKVNPNPVQKVASLAPQNNNQNNNQDNNNLKYLPHATALGIGALLAIQAAQGKNVITHNAEGIKDVGMEYLKRTNKPVKIMSKVIKDAKNGADFAQKNRAAQAKAYSKYKTKATQAGESILGQAEWAKRNWGPKAQLLRKYEQHVNDALHNNKPVMEFHDWKKENNWKWNKDIKGWETGDKVPPAKEKIKKKMKTYIDKGVDAGVRGAMFSGMATAANFIGHEIGDSYFRDKDKDETRRHFREDWNRNFADHIVKGKRMDRSVNTGYQTPKQITKNRLYKQAGVEDFVDPNAVDDGIKKVKQQLKGKALAKDIIKNDLIKGSLTGLAYAAVPATVAYATKRDRNTLRKLDSEDTKKTVIELPENIIKKASVNLEGLKKLRKELTPENVPEEMIRNGVRGFAKTTPVAGVSYMLNRNLRGNLEKLDDEHKKVKPIEKGKVRIIVERRV